MPETEPFRLDFKTRHRIQTRLLESFNLHGTAGAEWLSANNEEIRGLIDNPDFEQQMNADEEKVVADLKERLKHTLPPVEIAA